MKVKFVSLLMALLQFLPSVAEVRDLKLHPTKQFGDLTRDYPRSPIRIPDAYIDGHTLTFDASCIGSTLTLTQDDIIIYSATVEENENGEGEVILPDYLTGEYEIEIEYGSFVLVGNLEIS